jgi:hypothetical protein
VLPVLLGAVLPFWSASRYCCLGASSRTVLHRRFTVFSRILFAYHRNSFSFRCVRYRSARWNTVLPAIAFGAADLLPVLNFLVATFTLFCMPPCLPYRSLLECVLEVFSAGCGLFSPLLFATGFCHRFTVTVFWCRYLRFEHALPLPAPSCLVLRVLRVGCRLFSAFAAVDLSA